MARDEATDRVRRDLPQGAGENRASPAVRPARSTVGWAFAALVVLTMSLAFQGTRGLWEPDEGFYTNPALAMLRSGDWILPRLNAEPFLDKPPLIYWSIAAGVAVLGVNEWGARLAHALWFLLTALVVGRLGADWWGRRTGIAATLIYAATLLPYLAANFLTPDTILAFTSTLAWLCGWRLATASRAEHRLLWGAALGAAVGLGALAKGPAALVFAAPVALHLLLHIRPRRRLFLAALAGAALFLALALPWYLYVISSLPGSGAYFLDNQILGRLVTERYARNPGWAGGIRVYLPTLILGALPWSLLWPAWIARARHGLGRRWIRALPSRRVASALALWFVLPLGVFFLASSRLPLYVLPLFAPLALATARTVTLPGALLGPGVRRSVVTLGVVWLVGLIAAKALLATYPYPKDTRRLAEDLLRAGVPISSLVVNLDMKGNGLVLYGFHEIEQVTNGRNPYPFFRPTEHLSEEMRELLGDRRSRVFVVGAKNLDELKRSLTAAGRAHTVRKLDRVPYWLVTPGELDGRVVP